MSSIYTSQEYKLDPSTIKFDTEITEFNREQNDGEYIATRESIKSIGQQRPIVINSNTNLCEDGRHRVKACTELGIGVVCIDIDHTIDKAKRIELYNIDAMSGRSLTTAQKAIQAHKFALISKIKLNESAVQFNISYKEVNAANTIAGLGREDIFDEIMKDSEGKWTKPDGKRTKSLRAIASLLKVEQEHLEEIPVDLTTIDYVYLLNTEKAKSIFWEKATLARMSDREMYLMIVELLNLKYRLKVDSETGEVTEEGEED
jgi:hypothetical protein